MTPEIRYLITLTRAGLARTRADCSRSDFARRHTHNQRGDIVQNVIMWALLAAAAIAITTIIVIKFTDKANTIPTG